MKQLTNLMLGGALTALLLTGCVDDKYDLANVDTTSEIKINDLVLPVNIDPITLDDIITVNEDDQLKIVTINGETFYAVQKTGTFESDDIEVNPFAAESDPMNPNTATFRREGAPQNMAGRKAGGDVSAYLIVDRVNEPLNYSSMDIDPSVRALTYINYKNMNFVMSIKTTGLSSGITSSLENVVLTLPKGLTLVGVQAPGYTFSKNDYDPLTGRLNLGTLSVRNNQVNVTVTSDAVDLSNYDRPFVFNEEKQVGEFTLDSEFSIEKGCRLMLTGPASEIANLPEELTFSVDYNVTRLEAISILGEIQYDLKGTGLAFDPVDLGDLPDFLADPETDLVLANPQIYLTVDNPVGGYGLGYESGLKILAQRDNGDKDKEFLLKNRITVAPRSGNFNYMLAPDPNAVTNIPDAYRSGLNKLVYDDLGNILSGNGLPQRLDIELIDALIPRQALKEPFKLGVKIPGMKGTYEFLAPMALTGKSKIVYTKTEDGWSSEDLDDLTITSFELSTVASSNIPMEATLAVYPIDKEGRRISGLEIEPVVLDAYAVDVPLTFTIRGTIKDLDGIFITATVVPDGSEEVLTPTQTITLKQIRAKVSGNYTKKF